MPSSFFFYDLETSGFSPRSARIMQFAGQRTDLNLQLIGKPVNTLIKLTEDILPDPSAVMLTGITPQKTLEQGISEAEFLKLFEAQVATSGTIFVGYNTVRFDDEFMRFLHYRNFYDPYEWQWKNAKSRWDLLDVVRMTRALRPDGIKWPVDDQGRAANRLGLLAKANKLNHTNAHDALSDVQATIALAQLIQDKQPKLFNFLLKLRDKKQVAQIVKTGDPFIYTSGKYAGEFEKTTIACSLADSPKRQGVLVYDLRYDPTPFAEMSAKELSIAWQARPESESDEPRLPIKSLQFNRCPAVAPLSVLDGPSAKRLELDISLIERHREKLLSINNWPERLIEALVLMDAAQEKRYATQATSVDAQLYDGFFTDSDRRSSASVRAATPTELKNLTIKFEDRRLNKLLPLYKARNFPELLNETERQSWEKYRVSVLRAGAENSRLAEYESSLEDIATTELTSDQQKIVESLHEYAESIMPDSAYGSR